MKSQQSRDFSTNTHQIRLPPNESRPQREEIEKFLREAEPLHLSAGVRQKLEWFLYALDHGNDLQQVSEHFGISLSTFRRWLKRFDPDNPKSLEEKSRRPHAVREPDTLPEVVALIRQYRLRYPTMGKERIQKALAKEHGITLSPSTIGRVIERERFFFANTLSHLHKRTPETPPEHTTPTSGGAVTGLLLLVVTAATLFLLAPQADAAVSTSFQLYGAFPNEATQTPADSTSFKLNEGGVTWQSTPLVGSSIQIVAAPPASSSSSAASSSSEAEVPSQAGGGRRGRHPTVPSPRRPGVVRAKPAASETPEKRLQRAMPSRGVQPTKPFVEPTLPAAGTRSSASVSSVPVLRGYRSPLLPKIIHLLPTRRQLRQQLTGTGAEGDTSALLRDRQQPRWGAELLAPERPGSASPNWGIGLLILLVIICSFWVGLGTRRLYGAIHRRNGHTGNGCQRKTQKTDQSRRGGHIVRMLLLVTVGATLLLTQRAIAATVGPNKHVYNGHLLDSNSKAITTAHKIRFSYWKSADYVSTDTTATGAINTGASNYASWYEVQTVTPDSNGYFSVQLGSGTSLPSLASYTPSELQNLHLQVEVKSASAADTSYEVLDVDTSRTTVDRSPILSVPFALNADRVDQRDVGTGSGSIPVLQAGDVLATAVIPGGTNSGAFLIDANASETSTITLQFGTTIAKRLIWDITNDRFSFNDDLHVTGNLTGSGTLVITGAATFGSTVRINNVTYTFPYGDGTGSGKVLKTNSAGQLIWSDDLNTGASGLTYGQVSGSFVNQSGDVMTGALLIKNGNPSATADTGLLLEIVGSASGRVLHAQDRLTASGTVRFASGVTLNADLDSNNVGIIFGSDTLSEVLSWLNTPDRFEFSDDLAVTGNLTLSGTLKADGDITTEGDLTLNQDQTAANTVLTFGSDGNNETLTFLNASDRFEFSDDLAVTGNLTASGTLTVDGATILKSTLRINGVTYAFPTSDGTASGKILKTNGAGQLTFGNAGRSSGSILGLRPDYPNVAYFGSGASAVGTLSLRYSSGSELTNFYRWQTTRTSNQHQWISTQIRLPDTFSTWEASKPLELRYRTNSGYITAYMLDTNDAPVTLSSNTNLRSATWTTATITGPITSGTWAAGDYFTVLLRLTNSGATTLDKTFTDIGFLNIGIEESLP